MPTHSRRPVEHPLLPGEANSILAVVAFLFGSSGVLVVLGLVILLVGKLAGWRVVASVAVHPLGVSITLIVAVGYVATAWLLARRRRLGGMLGLWFIGLSFVGELLSLEPIGVLDVLWPAALLVALALSWSHLSGDRSP